MRVFLRPHRTRLVPVGVIEPRFLYHRTAAFDERDLALRLALDHRHHEAHRIDVFRLGARAERVARIAHADVHVGAHRALFHIAIARYDIAQDRAQLAHIGAGLGGRAHVGLRHDLHQTDARGEDRKRTRRNYNHTRASRT